MNRVGSFGSEFTSVVWQKWACHKFYEGALAAESGHPLPGIPCLNIFWVYVLEFVRSLGHLSDGMCAAHGSVYSDECTAAFLSDTNSCLLQILVVEVLWSFEMRVDLFSSFFVAILVWVFTRFSSTFEEPFQKVLFQCSRTCGNGVRWRRVNCHKVDEHGGTIWWPVESPYRCDTRNRPKPRQICSFGACTDHFIWQVENWSQVWASS